MCCCCCCCSFVVSLRIIITVLPMVLPRIHVPLPTCFLLRPSPCRSLDRSCPRPSPVPYLHPRPTDAARSPSLDRHHHRGHRLRCGSRRWRGRGGGGGYLMGCSPRICRGGSGVWGKGLPGGRRWYPRVPCWRRFRRGWPGGGHCARGGVFASPWEGFGGGVGLGAAVPAVEEGGPSLAGVCCVRDGLIWFAMREGERGGGQGGGREDKCVSTYCCGRPAMEEGDRGGGV